MKSLRDILVWLKGNGCPTAGLTSTDSQALFASVALCPLIGYSGAPPELFLAYRAIVLQMQPQLRWLAYHAIAMELDWSHRNMIWAAACLPEGDKPATKCRFE